jgi:hypothetical protein
MRIAALLLALALCGSAHAQTLNSFYAPTIPNAGMQVWAAGTDAPSAVKTIYTGAAKGSKCVGLFISNYDGTSTHPFNLSLHSATGQTTALAQVTLPIGAGVNAGTPALAPMQPTIWPGLPLDSEGNRYIYLPQGWTIQGAYASALGTGASIGATAICADFN